ncbi:hypothetical protein DDQ50_05570 [Amnibacterium flavum]|uniref:Protein-glutamine gamma-glutamyltransferase-like C-terminal domain-containing protein n=1 Tax=Amnibacterium flavum TaxID=2173173 RepID=A0A2V1HUV4_9MICO|nr:hypothetical protein DDQ50_05570 [Amnibacterium flavum]
MAALAAAALRSVPVDPDADEGRRLLTDELSKNVYQEAKPTWFDLLSQAVFDWFAPLLDSANGAGGAIGLAVAVAAIAALIVAGFLIFGRPRLERRRAGAGALFGSSDERTADEIRGEAERLARDGDYTEAIEEMFRAMARGLDERTLVDVVPGTTAGSFARDAARPFPDEAERLRAASADFDRVRYLGGSGSSERYEAMADLEKRLRTARPATAEAPA